MNEFIIKNVFLFELEKDKVFVFTINDEKEVAVNDFKDCVRDYIGRHYPDKAASFFSCDDTASKSVVVIFDINESKAKVIDLRE